MIEFTNNHGGRAVEVSLSWEDGILFLSAEDTETGDELLEVFTSNPVEIEELERQVAAATARALNDLGV